MIIRKWCHASIDPLKRKNPPNSDSSSPNISGLEKSFILKAKMQIRDYDESNLRGTGPDHNRNQRDVQNIQALRKFIHSWMRKISKFRYLSQFVNCWMKNIQSFIVMQCSYHSKIVSVTAMAALVFISTFLISSPINTIQHTPYYYSSSSSSSFSKTESSRQPITRTQSATTTATVLATKGGAKSVSSGNSFHLWTFLSKTNDNRKTSATTSSTLSSLSKATPQIHTKSAYSHKKQGLFQTHTSPEIIIVTETKRTLKMALLDLYKYMQGPKADTLLLLLATSLVPPICKKLNTSPILGFLMAGMAMGPNALGLISGIHTTEILAELGIVFFLFEMGIELSVERLRSMKNDVFGLGLSQFLSTAMAVFAIGSYFRIPSNALVVLGAGVALSSSAFVLQLLKDKNQLATRFGKASFGILLLQDLAVVPLLVVTPLLATAKGATATGAAALGGLAAAVGSAVLKASMVRFVEI